MPNAVSSGAGIRVLTGGSCRASCAPVTWKSTAGSSPAVTPRAASAAEIVLAMGRTPVLRRKRLGEIFNVAVDQRLIRNGGAQEIVQLGVVAKSGHVLDHVAERLRSYVE